MDGPHLQCYFLAVARFQPRRWIPLANQGYVRGLRHLHILRLSHRRSRERKPKRGRCASCTAFRAPSRTDRLMLLSQRKIRLSLPAIVGRDQPMSVLLHAVRSPQTLRRHRQACTGRVACGGRDELPLPPAVSDDHREYLYLRGLLRATQILPRHTGRVAVVQPLAQIPDDQGGRVPHILAGANHQYPVWDRLQGRQNILHYGFREELSAGCTEFPHYY
mmetsp:Transcript_11890/g.23687  ORF Transcript_11890/g.23687 Transcript_11890/m.23687 type:complete len:219 (+) Transcript_11890:939-1595(+)